MEVILSIIGFSLFVTGLFGLLGNEDSSPLAVTAGLLLMFTSFCIYLFAVNDIKEYTVDKIEIISNEIEQPFRGDPNDLPVDKIINEIQSIYKWFLWI